MNATANRGDTAHRAGIVPLPAPSPMASSAGLSFARVSSTAWRGVLAAALVVAGGLALAEPALGQAEVELLNTTLTPADIPVFGTEDTAVGCGPTRGTPYYCGIRMTDDDFTEAGVTYSIAYLAFASIVSTDDNHMRLDVNIRPTLSTRLQSMTLHVGSQSFAAASASTATHGTTSSAVKWRDPGLTWTADTPVTIRLTRANVAPTAAHGEVVTPANSAYAFTASDFRFSDVDAEHGQSLQGVRIVTLPASGKGALTLGGTAVTPTSRWPGRTSTAGSSSTPRRRMSTATTWQASPSR